MKENGIVKNPDRGDSILACVMCGGAKDLKVYPHKKKGALVGFVYSCCPLPKDEKVYFLTITQKEKEAFDEFLKEKNSEEGEEHF